MLFNKRRQSRDQAVLEEIQMLCQGKVLWMNEYSFSVYGKMEGVEIRCRQDFLQKAGTGEYALVETDDLEEISKNIEEILIFRWNRLYPSDKKLEIGRAHV